MRTTLASLLLASLAVPVAAQTPLGDEFQVNVRTAGSQTDARVSMDPRGDLAVVWLSHGGNLGDPDVVYARLYGADGAPATGEILVDPDALRAEVAIWEDGSFVVVSEKAGPQGVVEVARRFGPDGVPVGGESTLATGAATGFALAPRSDGGFVFVRSVQGKIGFRLFGPDAAPLGPERVIARGGSPAVAVGPDDEFVLSWVGVAPGPTPFGVRFVVVQRFGANGVSAGPRLLVRPAIQAPVLQPAVAKDGAGSFVVVWSDNVGVPGSKGEGMFARRFAKDGTPQGGTVRLERAGRQPSLAIDRNGNFVVAWGDLAGASDTDVFAQRFTAGGGPFRPAFRANTFKPGFQEGPRIAGTPDGDFVVVWQSTGQDGSLAGIFGQRFRKR